jgi:protein-arginine kinase activator protein McsA
MQTTDTEGAKEARCIRCERPLEDYLYRRIGFCPDCYKRVQQERLEDARSRHDQDWMNRKRYGR